MLVPVLFTAFILFFLIQERSSTPTGAACRARSDYIPRGDLGKRNYLHSGLRRQVVRASRVRSPFR
jgi:hypothetical protein